MAGLAETMFVACYGAGGRWSSASLGRVARDMSCSVPEAAVRLLTNAGSDFYAVSIMKRWDDEADLRKAMADPRFFLMGDGEIAGLNGALHDHAFSLSDWGYAPAFFARYVRDLGRLELPAAIAKLTSGPAEQIGLADRGRIATGSRADLVAFRLERIGTEVFPENLRAMPEGAEVVLVNGAPAVERGRLTGVLNGKVGRFA